MLYILYLIKMLSFQIFYKPFIHPNQQLLTQLFILINIILIYNPDFKTLQLFTEVSISLLINKLITLISVYIPTLTPIGFFINLIKKNSLISSLYSKYQLFTLEALKESLFSNSTIKYINLNTKKEEIAIFLGNYSILKFPLLVSPFTKWVYINFTIKDLKTTTYFQHLFFKNQQVGV